MTTVESTEAQTSSAAESPPWATVYTLPACVQCDMTKRQFTKLGVPFKVVDLSSEAGAEARERFKAEGLLGAPVVETRDGVRWNQFRPEKIKAAAVASQRAGAGNRAMGACFGSAPSTTARPAAPPEAGRPGTGVGSRTLAHQGSTNSLGR